VRSPPGQTPHRIAEEAKPPRNAATDVKPCNQCRAKDRSDGQDGEDKLAGVYLVTCVAGYVLRGCTLLFDQGVDRLLELRSVLLCGRECDLRLVLLIELVGTRSNDPVVRADGAKLLVKRGQLLLLRPIGNCIQVLGYLPFGRTQ
jgi:hypothetical protein